MSESVREPLSLFVQIALGLPLLIAVFVGGILFIVFRRRLGPLATTLGLAGCVLWVLGGVAAIGWKWFVHEAPRYISNHDLGMDTFVTLADLYAVVSDLMAALAMTLLLVAALARRPADRTARQG